MTDENAVRHWIEGAWVLRSRRATASTPRRARVIGTYADADADVGHRAVDAADRAFRDGTWSLDPMVRATALSTSPTPTTLGCRR
ncbi:hypothetical protein [Streptomyces sp. KL116D]|uniref:hypothetical protein n=1 Tax=Streptomyces sp. KL116D TaxID=3045152 RepID=UPI003555C2B9